LKVRDGPIGSVVQRKLCGGEWVPGWEEMLANQQWVLLGFASYHEEIIDLVSRKHLVYDSRPKIVASTYLDHLGLELVSGDIVMRDLLPIIDGKEVWDECGNDGLLE
jgi:hypothetical protein